MPFARVAAQGAAHMQRLRGRIAVELGRKFLGKAAQPMAFVEIRFDIPCRFDVVRQVPAHRSRPAQLELRWQEKPDGTGALRVILLLNEAPLRPAEDVVASDVEVDCRAAIVVEHNLRAVRAAARKTLLRQPCSPTPAQSSRRNGSGAPRSRPFGRADSRISARLPPAGCRPAKWPRSECREVRDSLKPCGRSEGRADSHRCPTRCADLRRDRIQQFIEARCAGRLHVPRMEHVLAAGCRRRRSRGVALPVTTTSSSRLPLA